jgi:ribosomal protein S18 acetylase RimI-like enzyme
MGMMRGIERRAVEHPADADFLGFATTYSLMSAPDEVPFMLGLVSRPARIIDLWEAGERALIGLVIDTCENATNAAEFMILASRTREIDQRLLLAALEFAETEAAETRYDVLELGVDASLKPVEPVLAERGYELAYTMVKMRRDAGAHEAAPLQPGLRFETISATMIGPARRLISAAFDGIPGLNLVPEDGDADRMLRHEPPARLLFRGDDLAGYVQVAVQPNGSGLVNVIARDPAHQASGLGRVLMDEALRVLTGMNCGQIELNAVAANDRALRLYEAYGFVIAESTPVYSRGTDTLPKVEKPR